MTDTQDLKRYKYGYSSDEWGMGRSLGLIPDPAGNVCLFADAREKLEAAQAEIDTLKYEIDAIAAIKAERDQALAEIERLTDINRDALSNLNELADTKNAEIERLKEDASNHRDAARYIGAERDAAKAEIERLKEEEHESQLHLERACRAKDHALARLAELGNQEPSGWVRTATEGPEVYDPLFLSGKLKPIGYISGYKPLFAAAGASPVQPSQALSLLAEMVDMMDSGDEHGSGSPWHIAASAALAASPVQPAQIPFAWAISACSRMWRGEFAEMDARAEAARCGGTCIAFPLYRAAPSTKEDV